MPHDRKKNTTKCHSHLMNLWLGEKVLSDMVFIILICILSIRYSHMYIIGFHTHRYYIINNKSTVVHAKILTSHCSTFLINFTRELFEK